VDELEVLRHQEEDPEHREVDERHASRGHSGGDVRRAAGR
jgi:hypothetical protein